MLSLTSVLDGVGGALPQAKRPTVEEDGWALWRVWTGGENYVPTRVRIPDCPACSESLYWASLILNICYSLVQHRSLKNAVTLNNVHHLNKKCCWHWCLLHTSTPNIRQTFHLWRFTVFFNRTIPEWRGLMNLNQTNFKVAWVQATCLKTAIIFL